MACDCPAWLQVPLNSANPNHLKVKDTALKTGWYTIFWQDNPVAPGTVQLLMTKLEFFNSAVPMPPVRVFPGQIILIDENCVLQIGDTGAIADVYTVYFSPYPYQS